MMRISIFRSKKKSLIGLISILILSSNFCSINTTKYRLSLQDKEFIDITRYIITPQEKKIFLELPPEERSKFVEEFWKRRDPDPETEENEYKETFFQRIEEANRLFSVSRPGWMTDRGEIYILFGPPTNIEKYPMGQGPGTKPMEIWYYGNFPILFVDLYGTGDYQRLEDNVIHLHELNKAIEAARLTLRYDVAFFDFSIRYHKDNNIPYLDLIIPYQNLWLKSNKNGGNTTLQIKIKITNLSGEIIWESERKHPIMITDLELKKNKNMGILIKIELPLSPGNYILYVKIINLTDNLERKKSIRISV